MQSLGSIPAGAGEPRSTDRPTVLSEVYPRGCGGTGPLPRLTAPPNGLSPRVRGNLIVTEQDVRVPGSIPAGAGEPGSVPRSPDSPRVYPRGCGGTRLRALYAIGSRGLSPRVRGNRAYQLDGRGSSGSIPAGAGEPLAILADWPRRVHYESCPMRDEQGARAQRPRSSQRSNAATQPHERTTPGAREMETCQSPARHSLRALRLLPCGPCATAGLWVLIFASLRSAVPELPRRSRPDSTPEQPPFRLILEWDR